ncbi:Multidrug resistance protein ABC transporter [Phytophthora megakarya]|uniref:Multidrug resistance protein ABC transporter n=1 Tax=Phytophthora megakarya TaxID=4795 RepID=A0A225WME7_9STRA|nr:Multidrug resistance protein ABC transporter [Phytophthora megakarya]
MNESNTKGLPNGWDGKDWRRYRWTMRTIFREHGLLEIAEGKIIREKLISEEGEVAFDKKQYKIMLMIGTTIPSDRLQQVDHYESGSEMWAGLCEIYEKRQNATIRESTILRLSEELKSMKCSADADVQAHVSYMFRLKTELGSYGYEVNNINMKAMLLASLPDQSEFNQLRGAIKYGGNGGSMTPEDLRVMIEEAAERQSRRQGEGNGGQRQISGRESRLHGRGGSRSGGHSDTNKKNGITRACFKCGALDHLKANCPEMAKKLANNSNGYDGKRHTQSNYTRSENINYPEVAQEPGVVTGAITVHEGKK